MSPLPGLDDKFSKNLSIRKLIEARARELFQQWGYKEYSPPLIERVETFGEEVTGPSPWPEFSEREYMLTTIPTYSGDEEIDRVRCLLRPEGTAPLCRALARRVRSEGLEKVLSDSLRFFYIINCYRNEPLEALSETKRREFGQIGLELMGFDDPGADTEMIYLANALMERIGIPKDDARVRLSDVNIFRSLSRMSDLPVDVMTEIKTKLDNLSKGRVYQDESQTDQLQREVSKVLDRNRIKGKIRGIWELVYSKTGDENLVYELSNRLQDGIDWENLALIVSELRELGINVIFDPAVIRGWEYYTGPVFQVDVVGRGGIFPERAGGGRYNTLVKSFLEKYGLEGQIPATGFGFGTERLEELVRAYGAPSGKQEFELYLDFKPDVVCGDIPYPKSVIDVAQRIIRDGKGPITIYWGSLGNARRYADNIGVGIIPLRRAS